MRLIFSIVFGLIRLFIWTVFYLLCIWLVISVVDFAQDNPEEDTRYNLVYMTADTFCIDLQRYKEVDLSNVKSNLSDLKKSCGKVAESVVDVVDELKYGKVEDKEEEVTW